MKVLKSIFGLSEIGNYNTFQIWDLSIPSERAPSKLSENQKIVEIGP